MTRAILAILLPLIVPFAVWFFWIRWHRARRLKAGLDPNVAPDVPVTWLALAAGILMIMTAGLFYFYSEQGVPAGTPYVAQPDKGVNLDAWPVGAEKSETPPGPDQVEPAK
jgi:drug/metabolite transporter (DMT)-like permease